MFWKRTQHKLKSSEMFEFWLIYVHFHNKSSSALVFKGSIANLHLGQLMDGKAVILGKSL